MAKKKNHEDPREKHGKLLIKKIEESIKTGSPMVPWRATWDPGKTPRNIRGNVYRGGNLLMALFASMIGGYESPFYLTFNQALEHGGIVKEGEKSWPIIFWKWWTPGQDNDDEPDEKDPRKRATAFSYAVFNLDQCRKLQDGDLARIKSEKQKAKAGSPEKWEKFVIGLKENIATKRKIDPIKAAEKIHKSYANMGGPKVVFSGSAPKYSPSSDVITLPKIDQFHSAVEYHFTRFHEETHSTGHKSRLNRKEMQEMVHSSDHNYSREELTAEFGAAMLASMCGIEQKTIDNTVSYLRSWLKALKNDPRLLYAAAQDAQRATDLILNIKETKQEKKAS